MKYLSLAVVYAIAALDQQLPSGGGPVTAGGAPAAKPAPVIPIEAQAEYYRADGVLAHLQAELAKANGDYEAAVKAIVKACGEGYIAIPTEDKKHLYCTAAPPAPAPAAKK